MFRAWMLGITVVCFAGSTWAQQVPSKSRTATEPPGAAQRKQQEGGAYPDLKRDSLPLGAINKQWSEICGQDSTTIAVGYRPNSEIRFRVRQMLGTVVTFPERVGLVSAPSGSVFTAAAHGDNGAVISNVWV